MTWLILILIHLFQPNVPTPEVHAMCERLEATSGGDFDCVDLARGLHRSGFKKQARQLLTEISNGF